MRQPVSKPLRDPNGPLVPATKRPKEPTFDVSLYYDAKRMENAGLLRPGTALVIASAGKPKRPKR